MYHNLFHDIVPQFLNNTASTSKEEQSFDILFDQVIDVSKVRVVVTSVASPLYPAIYLHP